MAICVGTLPYHMPQNKIFGLQEEIKQEDTTVQVKLKIDLSKLKNTQSTKVYHNTCLLQQFLSSPIHRDQSANVVV